MKKKSEKLGLFSGYSGQGGFVGGSVIRTGPSEGYRIQAAGGRGI